MANYTNRKQIPANSSGSFTPKGITRPPKYVLAEKIREMIRYARPQVSAFPARDGDIRDALRSTMLAFLLLAVKLDRIDNAQDRRRITKEISDTFANLKELIVLASDRDYYNGKYAPPLSLKKREVWGRYNKDIGLLIEGLEKG